MYVSKHLEEPDFLQVIEAAVSIVLLIDYLAEELDRWLCSVRLSHGHIQIIHEKKEGLARGGPEQILADPLELLFKEGLSTQFGVTRGTVDIWDTNNEVIKRAMSKCTAAELGAYLSSLILKRDQRKAL